MQAPLSCVLFSLQVVVAVPAIVFQVTSSVVLNLRTSNRPVVLSATRVSEMEDTRLPVSSLRL